MNAKEVVLIDYRGFYPEEQQKDFKVESLKNSTEYCIGDMLSKQVVDDLCRFVNWNVKIKGRK